MRVRSAQGAPRDELVDQLRHTLGKMEAALSSIAESFVCTDSADRIEWCNDAFSRLIGRSRIETIGLSLYDVLPLEQGGKAVEGASHPVTVAAVQGSSPTGTYSWSAPDGPRTLEVSAARIPTGSAVTSVVLTIHDITTRVALEEELRLRALHESLTLREREEFLSLIAHELRLPLAAIRALADGLAQSPNLDERESHAAASLHAQTERLVRLAEDLLLLGSLESGKFSLETAEVDLVDVVRQASARATEPARVRLDLPPGPFPVYCDAARIGQCLDNLLDNALKYSRRGSPVVLRLRHLETGARIEVVDQGTGVPTERRAHLFRRFSRLGPDSPSVTGFGLGLYLTRLIVEAHGGSVHVEDVAAAVGTMFVIELPAESAIH